MIAEYKNVSRFVHACDEFRARLVELHNGQATAPQVTLALVEYAPAVLAGFWECRGVFVELGPDVQADIGMLHMMHGIADRAEKEGDAILATDQRDAHDRMCVHVARRIVETLTGSVETQLERQLKASVERAARVVVVPLAQSPRTTNLERGGA